VCEKCVEIDSKIEHYKAMRSRILDKITVDGISDLIAELEAKKAELHPDQKE
jgi:hypothetical protein